MDEGRWEMEELLQHMPLCKEIKNFPKPPLAASLCGLPLLTLCPKLCNMAILDAKDARN